jgi:membrane protein DedA with SNARE-associated domain
MESFTELLRDWIGHEDNLAGLGVLAGSAAIEYVFPPFPGDAVTLFGAVLVTGYGWSFGLVLGAVMLGSLVGALAAYQLGVVWARRRSAKPRPLLDAVVARFRRHGPIYIVVNRFLPGVRGLIFVAAGLAGVDRRRVLLYATISALAWNLAIMGLGAALGANLDALEELVETYTMAAWAVVIVVIGVALLVWLRRRRRDTRVK